MASKAAELAVSASGLTADDIDLILVATCTPDYFFPSAACFVSRALKIKKSIPTFDISAACSGFVYAMDVAKQYISTGAAKHVLVIGSERMSKAVDWTDRSTCILFGDGAGAVVLSASDRAGILGSVLHSSLDEELLLALPNATFQDKPATVSMRGNEVFKLAVNIMGDVVDEVLDVCQLKKSDVDWLIPHQANIRIIQAIAKKLALPMSQVIVTIGDQGNTSAASIPLALDYSIKNNKIKRNDVLLIESFGGGMTWGAQVIRY
jgi:3-oxoacyl-[acyl-carrier-protein] synthase-3